jgi:hypothetical protein
MRIIGSSAMSRDVLCRVSGPALGWRNRLSLRSGPATSRRPGTRRTPPIGQPHLGRTQPGAAGAEERAQLAAPVPHRTAGLAGLLIIGHSTHDEPRIPRPLASCQVVALPGAAGRG